MSSLKEIKGRIASVRNTLKITSAMKMIASSKLHRAQAAIGSMLPYEHRLRRIALDLMADSAAKQLPVTGGFLTEPKPEIRRVAIVAISSNSTLCGGYNANVIKKTLEVIREYGDAGLAPGDISVFPIGRRMTDALRKAGHAYDRDYNKLIDRPSYDGASDLAYALIDGYVNGKFDRVEIVYNHFASTVSQIVRRDVYLPLEISGPEVEFNVAESDVERAAPMPPYTEGHTGADEAGRGNFIVEPSAEEELRELLPKVLRLKIYTVLLDASAAEHAARTVAMQTATDNGNNLLQTLTVAYNKGRQQKITNEILDIIGGTLK